MDMQLSTNDALLE